MLRIRKFVVGATVAAGLAALAMLLATQTAIASTASIEPAVVGSAITSHGAVAASADCTAAIKALKAAVVADRTEDAAERAVAKTEGSEGADQVEDAAEIANFRSLWNNIRSACAPAAPVVTRPATTQPSAACTAAVQALKAAWAQGRPTTPAQWLQLESLAQAAKTACGWTWGTHH